MKYLRIENGLDLCFDEFNTLCKKERMLTTVQFVILHIKMVWHHMNRTLMEKVTCMLSNAQLSKSF